MQNAHAVLTLQLNYFLFFSKGLMQQVLSDMSYTALWISLSRITLETFRSISLALSLPTTLEKRVPFYPDIARVVLVIVSEHTWSRIVLAVKTTSHSTPFTCKHGSYCILLAAPVTCSQVVMPIFTCNLLQPSLPGKFIFSISSCNRWCLFESDHLEFCCGS